MSTNTSFLNEFQTAVQAKDQAKQIEIMKQVAGNGDYTTPEVRQLVTIMVLLRVPYFKFMEAFLNANPDTFHISRVFLAEFHAGEKRYEMATEYARTFLKMYNKIADKQPVNDLSGMMNSVAHAHLLMTAVYTDLGARSYSQRILNRALSMPIPPAFKEHLEKEVASLQKELEIPEAAALDQKWEEFFQSAKNFSELHALVKSKGYELLTRRLELLESNFRFKQGYTVDQEEMLQEVFNVTQKDSKEVMQALM